MPTKSVILESRGLSIWDDFTELKFCIMYVSSRSFVPQISLFDCCGLWWTPRGSLLERSMIAITGNLLIRSIDNHSYDKTRILLFVSDGSVLLVEKTKEPK